MGLLGLQPGAICFAGSLVGDPVAGCSIPRQ